VAVLTWLRLPLQCSRCNAFCFLGLVVGCGEEEGGEEQEAAQAAPTCMRCALERLPEGPCW
jgi:hypothetical protein